MDENEDYDPAKKGPMTKAEIVANLNNFKN